MYILKIVLIKFYKESHVLILKKFSINNCPKFPSALVKKYQTPGIRA